MSVEEIGEDFTQSDLVSDDVMILDGGRTIYVWIGSGSNADEKRDGPEYDIISYPMRVKAYQKTPLLVLGRLYPTLDISNCCVKSTARNVYTIS